PAHERGLSRPFPAVPADLAACGDDDGNIVLPSRASLETLARFSGVVLAASIPSAAKHKVRHPGHSLGRTLDLTVLRLQCRHLLLPWPRPAPTLAKDSARRF